jgi:chromosome segregation ATPase
MIAKEKDDLAKCYNDVIKERDSIANMMSIELQATKEENESLQCSLSETEESLSKIASEKKALEEDQKALKNSLKEASKALEIVSRDMAELEQQKRELENNLYTKLLENKGKHSDAISAIQTRLNETEGALASVRSERDGLQCTVRDLEDHNQSLSLELENSKSYLASETADWEEEKRGMNKERVEVASRSNLENTLGTVCTQQATLEAQTINIERELSRALMETKGKHSKKIADIQVRLENTVSGVVTYLVHFFLK